MTLQDRNCRLNGSDSEASANLVVSIGRKMDNDSLDIESKLCLLVTALAATDRSPVEMREKLREDLAVTIIDNGLALRLHNFVCKGNYKVTIPSTVMHHLFNHHQSLETCRQES